MLYIYPHTYELSIPALAGTPWHGVRWHLPKCTHMGLGLGIRQEGGKEKHALVNHMVQQRNAV